MKHLAESPVVIVLNMDSDKDMQEVIELIADIARIQAKYLHEVQEQALDDLADLVE